MDPFLNPRGLSGKVMLASVTVISESDGLGKSDVFLPPVAKGHWKAMGGGAGRTQLMSNRPSYFHKSCRKKPEGASLICESLGLVGLSVQHFLFLERIASSIDLWAHWLIQNLGA